MIQKINYDNIGLIIINVYSWCSTVYKWCKLIDGAQHIQIFTSIFIDKKDYWLSPYNVEVCL